MTHHPEIAVAAWLGVQGEGAPPMAGAPTEGQPAGPGPAGGGGGTPQSSPFGPLIFLPLILIIIFMMITGGRRQSKERKAREEMISGLRRNDRVQTTGGMLGKIVEIKADEVVLKVDEATNTRIRFSKSAIQQVVSQAAGGVKEEVEADAG